MSDTLTIEQLAEDLSVATEMGGVWGYGIKGGELVAEHYGDDGEIDKTVTLNITFSENN